MNGLDQPGTFDQMMGSDLTQCLWMQAGVVDYKLCDRHYDCENCAFDEALHSRPGESNYLRKMSKHAAELGVQGCDAASHLFYHPAHVWARIEEGGTVRAGLDDFGQRMLGRAYSVSLPSLNTSVRRGEQCWNLTHQCGVTALVSPVSGKIQETNSNLYLRPELLNHDPYLQGWAILIEPDDLKSCLKRLMYGERVRRWLQKEIEKLRLLMKNILDDERSALNTTMMDGGSLTQEIMAGLNVEQMRRVISSFFPLLPINEAECNHAILDGNGR